MRQATQTMAGAWLLVMAGCSIDMKRDRPDAGRDAQVDVTRRDTRLDGLRADVKPDVTKPDVLKPATCGDGIINGLTEVCDGQALGVNTCLTHGFDGGALKCAADCKSLDTSGCYKCGDGVINGNEQCDKLQLGGKTCASLGYDGGTLACAANCVLNTAGCFKCGDGTINGTEECDGSQLGGKTCKSQGFTGGSLSCTVNCAIDTSPCYKLSAEISVSTASQNQVGPSVAFGGNYLVGWSDSRNTGMDRDVFAARVTTAGQVLDGSGIQVVSKTGAQHPSSTAYDGNNFVLAWWHGGGIAGARVSPAGTVLDTVPIPVSSVAISIGGGPAIACGGTNCLVVWSGDGAGGDKDIFGARVQAGSLLDGTPILISTISGSLTVPAANDQRFPSIAWDGANYLVVWEDDRSVPSREVYGARVSPSGALVDKGGIKMAYAPGTANLPDVASDGADFFVAWCGNFSGTDDNIYGTRVSAAGTVLASGIPISQGPGTQGHPRVAFGKGKYLVVWLDLRNLATSGYDVYGARVTPSGTVVDIDGIPITTATKDQSDPDVASDGTEFFVVWGDLRSGSYSDIYGVRVAP